jgi:hypothetical protein
LAKSVCLTRNISGVSLPKELVRADRIVIVLPLHDDLPGIIKTQKPVHVQAFIPEPADNALDVGVVDRFVRTIECQYYPISMSLGIKLFTDESGPLSTVTISGIPLNLAIHSSKSQTRLSLIDVSTSMLR